MTPKQRKNLIGNRVRLARGAMKQPLTQDALSGRLAQAGCLIDRSAIAKIETGIRGVSDLELVAFCRVLRVTPNWLLGFDGGSKGPQEAS
ncbi:hypothetical protein ASA1KI_06910 [Opitutales bacterium ASA1]|uniref:helix-turn-helix domain-containing protein n=1 Tax=Congregicoccus parvus TaxID=3081749 RepID=UPI002B31A83A|nr:hypothetical protein ASA1KI_06910 [Opitutales bacterium ASA1]